MVLAPSADDKPLRAFMARSTLCRGAAAAPVLGPRPMSAPEENPVRETRITPIVPSESVLVATARGMRPKKAEAPAPRDARAHVETCPFCSGNEHMTPPVIAAYPGGKNWEIRIVENLYPVLGDDRSNPNLSFGLQQTIDG